MKRPRAYGVLGETQFSTEIFEMTLEKDEWRIDLLKLYGFGSTGFRGGRGRRP